MTDRPAPPPIKPRCPDCPLCGEETRWDHDGYACEPCGATWPERVTGEEVGTWDEPDEPQCEETVQPYLDNTWIPNDDPRKHLVFRCLLTEGHAVFDKPTPHANPEMTCFAKGWAS